MPVARAAGVDPVFSAHDAARGRAALVSRRHRPCSSTPGWPAVSAARRAATTRWCSARWCRTDAASTTRSGSCPRGRRSTSSCRSTRISTARASSRGWRDRYSPEKVVEWVSRKEGSRAYYSVAVSRTSSAPRSRRAWARVGKGRARVPAAEPGGSPPVSAHAVPRPHASARSGRSRAPTTIRPPARSSPPFNYPGVVAHVGAIAVDDWRGGAARGHQGADDLHGDVARLRPAAGTLFYTTDNGALPGPRAPRSVRRGGAKSCCKDARIGDLAFNRADNVALGHSPSQRHLHARAHAAAVPRVEAGRLVAVRNGDV